MTICELANGVVPFYDMPETLMLTEKVRGCAPHIIDRSTFPRDPEDLDNPEIKQCKFGGADYHLFIELLFNSSLFIYLFFYFQ